MRFIKYQVVLNNLNETDYNTKFDDENFWPSVEVEAVKYGIHGVGINKNDEVVMMGEIKASTSSGCNGVFSEFKAWLKKKYNTKVTECLVAKGTSIF